MTCNWSTDPGKWTNTNRTAPCRADVCEGETASELCLKLEWTHRLLVTCYKPCTYLLNVTIHAGALVHSRHVKANLWLWPAVPYLSISIGFYKSRFIYLLVTESWRKVSKSRLKERDAVKSSPENENCACKNTTGRSSTLNSRHF